MLNLNMTREQFADALNMHPDQISRYVTAGILEPAITERVGRRYKIDYTSGKLLLDAHVDMSKSRAEPDHDTVTRAVATAESKERKLRFEALHAELKYRKDLGELVEASVVETEAFNEARLTRDRILQIPDRIAHSLAAESDVNKVFQILRDELNDSLNMLAHG